MDTKKRLYVNENEEELKEVNPESVLAAANDVMKDRWISILIQLTNSHRFNKFLESNFVIQDIINEEEKTIETRVIERPDAVGPPLSSNQLADLQKLMQLHNAEDPQAAFEAIMAVLGQEPPKVVIATDV